jgi:hypothetical protein
MTVFSKKADFENVKKDPVALKYHAERFEQGHRDSIAVQSYIEHQKNADSTKS